MTRLFHATCAAKDSKGNYCSFPEKLMPFHQYTSLGTEGDFVFASEKPLELVAYALKTRSNDKDVAHLVSSGTLTCGIPFGIIFDPCANFPKNHPAGVIFEVETQNFYQEKEGSHEWISRDEVKILNRAREVDVDFAMKVGVQFFVIKDIDAMKEFQGFMKESVQKLENGIADFDDPMFHTLENFLKEQKITHFNAEEKINAMNLESKQVKNDNFIKNPQKIFERPISVVTSAGSGFEASQVFGVNSSIAK